MFKFKINSLILIGVLFFNFSLNAQEISTQRVDETVINALEAFNVPGMAVGIVHNGKVVLAKGYGVTDINTGEKVNSATNFGIASNSKAFTGAALVLLEEQGRLNLDDRVKKHIPEFELYDEYVTEHFTIRDLLTHRSGMGLGAGDLMVWPDGHDFTPEDIIKNIKYLKPVSDFRTKYDYDNLLYIIAGVVIENVSGQTWTEYITENFLQPLKMNRTAANWNLLEDKTNAISPHVPLDGELKVVDRYTNSIFDAAAGLYSNVDDLSLWLQFLLNKGMTVDGERLMSEQSVRKLMTPQTIVPARTTAPYNTLFANYGLGFFLQDVGGKLEVSHTGGLEGIVTQLIIYPQLNLGIIVLTNQQEGTAFRAVSNTIKDFHLGLPEKDWVAEYAELIQKRNKNADTVTEKVWAKVDENKNLRLAYIDSLPGTYTDNWFGDVKIWMDKGKLRFASQRSPQLTGDMFYFEGDKFAVKWDNPYLHADALVLMETENGEVKGFKMLPISPLTDFSYDFQDLDFKKAE